MRRKYIVSFGKPVFHEAQGSSGQTLYNKTPFGSDLEGAKKFMQGRIERGYTARLWWEDEEEPAPLPDLCGAERQQMIRSTPCL